MGGSRARTAVWALVLVMGCQLPPPSPVSNDPPSTQNGRDGGAGPFDGSVDGSAGVVPRTDAFIRFDVGIDLDARADATVDASTDAGVDADVDATVVFDAGPSPPGWFGLGGSELVPHSVRYHGSASGGGVSANAGFSTWPAVAVDSAGRTIVAWQEWTTLGANLYVLRWNGGDWEQLDGSGSGTGLGSSCALITPALVADQNDDPVVAWPSCASGSKEIYLLRWTAGAWQELAGSATGGGISNSGGSALGPELAIDPSNHPVVAWTDNLNVYLKRFDGSAWVEVDGSATGGGVSNDPSGVSVKSLILDASGEPIVAWDDPNAAREIFVARHTVNGWEHPWGYGVAGVTAGHYPSVALDSMGRPTVAWASDQVFSKIWDGSAWIEVAGSASGGGISQGLSGPVIVTLLIDALDHPWVSWDVQSRSHVKRFDGTAWVDPGGAASGNGLGGQAYLSGHPAMALAPTGLPVVAWEDAKPGFPDVYLRAFDGTSWRELGVSAMPGGISQVVLGRTLRAALTIDGLDRPSVAWIAGAAYPSSFGALYMKRFDGVSWQAMSGSDVNDGLSSPPRVRDLDMAVDSQHRPVIAWIQDGPVMLLRHEAAGWQELAGSATDAGLSSGLASASAVRVEIDDADQPVVLFFDALGLHWTRFDGNAWNGGVVPQATGTFDFALDANQNLVVAWQGTSTSGVEQIYLARHVGAEWSGIGGSDGSDGVSATAASSTDPALAIGMDGFAVVAWREGLGSSGEIFARRWDGTSWIDLAGSASGGGISASGEDSRDPQIGVDVLGRVCVAWLEGDPQRFGGTEVWLRRYDGVSWQGVAGSDSAGGISNSKGPSTFPDLFVRRDLLCVSWLDIDESAHQALMRCTRD